MDTGLKGKTACVAGASRGLGRAAAAGLAAEGCDLALCARGEAGLARAAEEIASQFGVQASYRPVDLSQKGAAADFMAQTLERFGGLDVLVTNAGGPPAGGFDDFSEDDWRAAVELTLLPAQALVRAALKPMRAQGDGRIINMTSVSVKQPIAGLILSNSIRAAVIGWAKTLADEAGPQGIRVNNICTGWIHTERVDELLNHRARTQGVTKNQALKAIETAIPLGRLGRPSEYADLVVFLASDRSSYITGVSYLIDGGLRRGLM